MWGTCDRYAGSFFFVSVFFCSGLLSQCSLLAFYQMDVQNKSQGLIAADFFSACLQAASQKAFCQFAKQWVINKPMSWCYQWSTRRTKSARNMVEHWSVREVSHRQKVIRLQSNSRASQMCVCVCFCVWEQCASLVLVTPSLSSRMRCVSKMERVGFLT